MTDDQNWDEQIYFYLSGKMDAVSRLAFEAQLSINGALRAELETQQKMLGVIRMAGRKQLKRQLQLLHRENIVPGADRVVKVNEKNAKGVFSIGNRIWLAAASVLVLITTFLFLHYADNKEQKIFVENFTPYPLLAGLTRGENDIDTTAMQAAMLFYGQSKYQAFIDIYKENHDLSHDEQFLFYLGNAYLASNQPALAEITFKKYLGSYSKLATESQWYLALSYLKQQKKTEAVTILKKLSAYGGSYSKKASTVLTELE